mgnify:CR=1 FL=1
MGIQNKLGELVDSHCHINFPDFENDLCHVLTRADSNGVEYLLCVCVDLADIPQIIYLTEKFHKIFGTVGVHPNTEYLIAKEPSIEDLQEVARQPKIVAIGETGLDYFRATKGADWQKDRFRAHIEAAKVSDLPLIVHTRNARTDTIEILEEQNADQCGGVMHCFTEDWDMAKKAIDMGFYISISGIVTFKNAVELKDVVKQIPLDRLLIETDSPYLAPLPYRGKSNEPSYIIHTVEKLSQIKKITKQNVITNTTNNFKKLFDIN